MENLLFINSCIRENASRTLQLAHQFLSEYQQQHKTTHITERNLMKDRLEPQYPEILEKRDEAINAGKLDDPMFTVAKQFAQADKIVIAAPFWDLSFPAILKIYLERISVMDITFGYDDNSHNIGLCKASKLLFITTRGGDFTSVETEWMDIGTRHLKALCAMYGIDEFHILYAESLDDIRKNPQDLMQKAFTDATHIAKIF